MKNFRIMLLWYALAVIMFLTAAGWYSQQLRLGIERSLALETQAAAAQMGYLLSELYQLNGLLDDLPLDSLKRSDAKTTIDLVQARISNLLRVNRSFKQLDLGTLVSVRHLADPLAQIYSGRGGFALPPVRARLNAAVALVSQLYARLGAQSMATFHRQANLIQQYQYTMGVILVLLVLASFMLLWLMARQRRLLALHQLKLENTVLERTREMRAAVAESEDANRAKSDFLARMSHELRTPLNAIIGITEMLREDIEENQREDEIEPLERVLSASEHLLSLINDILDLSKIEAGKMELTCFEFEVQKMIESVVATVQLMARVNRNSLELELPSEKIRMMGDEIRLRQVLYNLISNACKFTENGKVTIAAKPRIVDNMRWLEFKVSDTGIGIDPELKEKLFGDFVQGRDAAQQRYGGTGLGLAICQRLVEIMGGRIEVQSALKEGSEFSVLIPRDSAG